MALPLGVVAAEDFGTGFPSWMQFSAVAILVGGMAVALRVMYKLLRESIDRERARADKAEADYDQLSREFLDRLIPTGITSQQTLADMAGELRRATDEIRALRERRR